MLIIVVCIFSVKSFCQQTYWQQKTDFKITVSLNDNNHTLTGYEVLDYYNNSPDTLHFIWMHLWPNAYKNDRTAFSDQLLQLGNTDFYFAKENQRGYINQLSFKVDKQSALMQDHPKHQDIVKLILPVPLAPGKKAKIETAFHEKLPYNFSRGGHINQSYQITQWYPKPAVYDKNGWHEMPYLEQGEFYSDFGNFDVEITLPSKYIIAATGNLINETTDAANKTVHFVQDKVHDFAWFADKNFLVKDDTLQLDNKIIKVTVYYLDSKTDIWKNSLAYIKNTLRTRSSWVGNYPYDAVSVVENAAPASGGMEYPMITLVDAGGLAAGLQRVIEHEVGHNWFYGILATNERSFPWMDEGMNTYYDRRYAKTFYDAKQGNIFVPKNNFLHKRFPVYPQEFALQTVVKLKKDQPLNTTSEKFSELNYGLIAYEKAAEWMKLLENELGTAMFDNVMHAYYERWKFKHPYPEDFKAVAEQVSGKNMDALFELQNRKGPLLKQLKKEIKLTSFFNLKQTEKYHYISVAPAAGINFYDKIMLGAVVHNYNLPPSNFQFFAAPLYATGTKKINGIGGFSYTKYTGNTGAKLKFGVAVSRFTGGSFKDSTDIKNPLQFSKIVPSLQYFFGEKDARSTTSVSVLFKTFLISETEISFSKDIVTGKETIAYPKAKRYINQLQFLLENKRILYPYNATLQAEQGDGFVRTAFTGNYYFNYPQGGGLNVRLFAGKFFYTKDKTFFNQFKTDRYHLNLSGPKGYEDYNYSNYFIGRNEFEGASSQQIMNRDGFFKVRTDLLSSKTGKTDNWLSAVNFTSSIPDKINPLSVLPFKLPIKLFADIGTYAEAWEKGNNTGRFLYDAGLQVSLFKNVVNIYVPILYSKVYSDYFKSTIIEKRFVKNISFSIDLQNIRAATLFPAINF